MTGRTARRDTRETALPFTNDQPRATIVTNQVIGAAQQSFDHMIHECAWTVNLLSPHGSNVGQHIPNLVVREGVFPGPHRCVRFAVMNTLEERGIESVLYRVRC